MPSSDNNNFSLENIIFQYFFEIKLNEKNPKDKNGKVIIKVENENPLSLNDVEVWAAQANHGYPPADAYIEDLRYGDPEGRSTQCRVFRTSRAMSSS